MKNELNSIHVAIAFDENYLTPYYTLLTSIFLNNRNNNISIHTIAANISEPDKIKLNQYAADNNAVIHFYNITEDLLSGLVQPGNTWLTMAAYYRIFFPGLVPATVNKLIYIDTDTVVIHDLAELNNTNTNSKSIAAVQEVLGDVRHRYRHL